MEHEERKGQSSLFSYSSFEMRWSISELSYFTYWKEHQNLQVCHMATVHSSMTAVKALRTPYFLAFIRFQNLLSTHHWAIFNLTLNEPELLVMYKCCCRYLKRFVLVNHQQSQRATNQGQNEDLGVKASLNTGNRREVWVSWQIVGWEALLWWDKVGT